MRRIMKIIRHVWLIQNEPTKSSLRIFCYSEESIILMHFIKSRNQNNSATKPMIFQNEKDLNELKFRDSGAGMKMDSSDS